MATVGSVVVFSINDLLYSFPNGGKSTPANSKLLFRKPIGEIQTFFVLFCFNPFVSVTFTERFDCREVALTSRIDNISTL